ncbi:MAG: DUF3108 domain-containing protein [Myxococcaceae bacterium]
MRTLPFALAALLASTSLAAGLRRPAPPPRPPPTDAECLPLPVLKPPFAFGAGESLKFDLDAMGAQAGKMTMTALPLKEGTLPVEVHVQTNTFFSKVRRVSGTGTSYLSPKTLRPLRYTEDAVENEVHRTANVLFRAKDHAVKLDFTINGRPGRNDFRYAHDGLDVAGAIYLMRQLPLKQGASVCFDVYGIRRMWRMSGKVEGKEHVSLPVGEFEAWHLAGEAVSLIDHNSRREVHVWISDDERRLPLAALGAIDIGVIRATLTGFNRPGDKKARAEGKHTMKW